MTSRARNIRQRTTSEEPTEGESSVKIHMRVPRTRHFPATYRFSADTAPLQAAGPDIQAQEHLPDESDMNEIFADQKIEMALFDRDLLNRGAGVDEIGTDGVNLLSSIAETGADEDVFEDRRRHRSIRFDGFLDHSETASFLPELDMNDEESQLWERAQVEKGIASAGVKVHQKARNATDRLGTDLNNEAEAFIEFGTLDILYSELIATIECLEVTRRQQATSSADLQTRLLQAANSNQAAIDQTCEKRIFYADLAEYLYNFSCFSNEAMALLESENVEFDDIDAFFEEATSEYARPFRLLNIFKLWRGLYPAEYDLALASQALPFLLEIFVRRQLCAVDLFADEMFTFESLPERLEVEMDSELRYRVLQQVYAPRLLSMLLSGFDPASSLHATRLRQWLNEFDAMPGIEPRSLRMFRFVLIDVIEEAKSACSEGSDRFQSIILTQSILQL